MPDAKLPHVAERHRAVTRLIGFGRCWISHRVTPDLPQVIPTRGGVGKTLEQRSGPTFAVRLATANIQSIPLPCAGSKIKGRLSKSAALGFRNLSSGGESRPPRPAPPSRQMPRVSPLITCNDRFLVGTAAVAYPLVRAFPFGNSN